MKILWKLMRVTVTHNVNKKNKTKQKVSQIHQFNARQSKKSVLQNRFIQPISLFSGYEASDCMQRKWVARLPQILLKTVSRNFQSLSTFTLLIYHFTRSRHREKPLFSAWKQRGKNPHLRFQRNLRKKIVLVIRKGTNDMAKKKNYLESATWGLSNFLKHSNKILTLIAAGQWP